MPSHRIFCHGIAATMPLLLRCHKESEMLNLPTPYFSVEIMILFSDSSNHFIFISFVFFFYDGNSPYMITVYTKHLLQAWHGRKFSLRVCYACVQPITLNCVMPTQNLACPKFVSSNRERESKKIITSFSARKCLTRIPIEKNPTKIIIP